MSPIELKLCKELTQMYTPEEYAALSMLRQCTVCKHNFPAWKTNPRHYAHGKLCDGFLVLAPDLSQVKQLIEAEGYWQSSGRTPMSESTPLSGAYRATIISFDLRTGYKSFYGNSEFEACIRALIDIEKRKLQDGK